MSNAAPDDAHPAKRYRRLAGVIETDLGTELILLDPASQAMFSLNAVGARIWRVLDSATEMEIVASLTTDFDVDHATALADMRTLLRQLRDAELIVAAD